MLINVFLTFSALVRSLASICIQRFHSQFGNNIVKCASACMQTNNLLFSTNNCMRSDAALDRFFTQRTPTQTRSVHVCVSSFIVVSLRHQTTNTNNARSKHVSHSRRQQHRRRQSPDALHVTARRLEALKCACADYKSNVVDVVGANRAATIRLH